MAVADTGCQSCLIGSKVVHYLGFRDRDLLGVEHRMNAVNQHSIDISDAVILHLMGLDKDGHQLQTTQICYVTPATDNCISAVKHVSIWVRYHYRFPHSEKHYL